MVEFSSLVCTMERLVWASPVTLLSAEGSVWCNEWVNEYEYVEMSEGTGSRTRPGYGFSWVKLAPDGEE